jgi:hypothetical protein
MFKYRRRFYEYLLENRIALVAELILIFFTIIGMLFFVVFVGMRLNLLSVRGSIDERNVFFQQNASSTISEIEKGVRECISQVRAKALPGVSFAWVSSPEWQTLSSALRKDKGTIDRAAQDAGIPSRLLVSVVISEQLRFFTSDRESFKKFFEPLKILGSLSQFSLGVSGVKPDTAKLIEDNLKNPYSPYYISKSQEHLLDVSSDEERFQRLTDSHDHYYSYLYTALFIREVEEQWKKAGFDISGRPEILSTLFNLGFAHSNPNANPVVAGSEITIGGGTYTFGRLSYEFYYSGELADIFEY